MFSFLDSYSNFGCPKLFFIFTLNLISNLFNSSKLMTAILSLFSVSFVL